MARQAVAKVAKTGAKAGGTPQQPSGKKSKAVRQAQASQSPAAELPALASNAATPARKRRKAAAGSLAKRPLMTEPVLSGELADVEAEISDEAVEPPETAAAAAVLDAANAKSAKRKRKSMAAALDAPDATAATAAAEPVVAAPKRKGGVQLETIPVAALRAAGAANGAAATGDAAGEPRFRNKEKVLMLTSRGIPPRHRHLMLDLGRLLPTAKRDAKLDTKSDRAVINEAAELKGCTSALFFEARKRKDCYLWAAKVPAGPTVKFLIVNVHTMAELKLSGNHLKGSRPVLSFDQAFDGSLHWQLMREVLTHIFATPKRHHKSKPFFDHLVSFSIADDRVWIRNYQVCPSAEKPKAGAEAASLIEVGPRACLNPILVLSGAFGGPVIWENPHYVSPNDLRTTAKRNAAGKYTSKVAKKQARRVHKLENRIPRSELDDVFK